MAKKTSNPIDKAIEQAYYVAAQNRQINIMDIPKVFADCRLAISTGEPVESAVKAAVEKYCTPA